jgi:hypothetical protein
LSEMAVQVKDKVTMGRHTKAGIAWVGSFTGRDIVVSWSALAVETLGAKDLDKYTGPPPLIHARFAYRSSVRSHQRAFSSESIMVRRGRLGHQATPRLCRRRFPIHG